MPRALCCHDPRLLALLAFLCLPALAAANPPKGTDLRGRPAAGATAASTDNERDASLSSHTTGNFVSSESLGIASGISRVAKGTTAPGGRAEDAISPRTKFLKLFGITTADTDPGEYTQSIAEVPAPLNDAAVWTGGWWGSLCNRFWEQR